MSNIRRRSECHTAAFDVDGTLVDATIIHYYHFHLRHQSPKWLRPCQLAWLYARLPYYALVDRESRRLFNRVFYRNYRGLPLGAAHEMASACFEQVMVPRIRPGAEPAIARHQQAGHRVVLLTGSLDFHIRPFGEHLQVDHVEATTLVVEQGRLTGEIVGEPLDGEEKHKRALAYAAREQIDMACSYAYTDSLSDLPLLEAVGNPVAVNPDSRLRRLAEERRWDVVDWSRIDPEVQGAKCLRLREIRG